MFIYTCGIPECPPDIYLDSPLCAAGSVVAVLAMCYSYALLLTRDPGNDLHTTACVWLTSHLSGSHPITEVNVSSCRCIRWVENENVFLMIVFDYVVDEL